MDRIRDAVGMPVDERIKTLVIALKASGFGTSGSCEGHLEHGSSRPYVDVESEAGERLWGNARFLELFRRRMSSLTLEESREFQSLVEPVIAENRNALGRLIGLVNEFYEGSAGGMPAGRTQLLIKQRPWYRGRVVPIWQEGEGNISSEEAAGEDLEEMMKEVNRFGEWLRQRFLYGGATRE